MRSRLPWACLGLALAVAAARPALATGYYSGNKGARAAGRAGAFAARADDLSAVIYNPAGLTFIDGTLLQLSNRFSYNSYEYTRAPTLDFGHPEGGVPPYVEFPAVHNETPFQGLEPLLGVASNLGVKDFMFALVVHAPAGVGREQFPALGPQRYMMVSREAIILNYSASAAYKVSDQFGVGASLQWIHVPHLRYSLVIDGNGFPGKANPVWSELDMLSTTTGSDPFTFNAVLGAWYSPTPSFVFGLSGQVIPTQIHTNSTLEIAAQSPNITDSVVLTRDGEDANDVHLSLPLPVTLRAGARYRNLAGLREVFDLELDVVYESWSRVERFDVATNGLTAHLMGQTVDIGDIEVEKHWNDTLSVALGGDYNAIPDRLTVRGGVFFESAVADRAYAHVDFVGGNQLGGTLGASVKFGKLELGLAYEYRQQPTVRVRESEAAVYQEVPGSPCKAPYTDPDNCHPAYIGQPAPAVNAGVYRAHSHSASLDVLYRL